MISRREHRKTGTMIENEIGTMVMLRCTPLRSLPCLRCGHVQAGLELSDSERAREKACISRRDAEAQGPVCCCSCRQDSGNRQVCEKKGTGYFSVNGDS